TGTNRPDFAHAAAGKVKALEPVDCPSSALDLQPISLPMKKAASKETHFDAAIVKLVGERFGFVRCPSIEDPQPSIDGTEFFNARFDVFCGDVDCPRNTI